MDDFIIVIFGIAGFASGVYLTGIISKLLNYIIVVFIMLVTGILVISMLPLVSTYLFGIVCSGIICICFIMKDSRESCSLLKLHPQDCYYGAYIDIRRKYVLPTVDKILNIFGLVRKTQRDIPLDSIDPNGVFKYIKNDQLDKYQRWFNKMVAHISDNKRQLDDITQEKLLEIANDAQDSEGLHSAYLLTFIFQYIDADPIMRRIECAGWVERIVQGGYTYCPDAESTFAWVIENFYS